MEAGRPRVPGSLSALHSKLAGGEWIDAHDNLILCGPMPTPAECAGTAIFIPVTNPLERSTARSSGAPRSSAPTSRWPRAHSTWW